MPKLTRDKLEKYSKKPVKAKNIVRVGMSTCGIAAGAEEVYETLKSEAENKKLDIKVQKCGCTGKCFGEPLVEVAVEGMPVVTYGKVNRDTALSIIDKHIIHKELLGDLIYDVKEENGEKR